MNGHEERKMGVRIIDMETREEIATFDSIPVDLSANESVNCSVETNINRKPELSAYFFGVKPNIVQMPLVGKRVDVQCVGVWLKPGEKIPKRKRQRKKWWKQRGEKMEIRNVLVEGAKE